MIMWYKKGASHCWTYKERELNSRVSATAQVRENRKNWASFYPIYTPLPRLRIKNES